MNNDQMDLTIDLLGNADSVVAAPAVTVGIIQG